jgi:hypothetical protein
MLGMTINDDDHLDHERVHVLILLQLLHVHQQLVTVKLNSFPANG